MSKENEKITNSKVARKQIKDGLKGMGCMSPVCRISRHPEGGYVARISVGSIRGLGIMRGEVEVIKKTLDELAMAAVSLFGWTIQKGHSGTGSGGMPH